MAGTFIFLHGTGVPNAGHDGKLIRRMLDGNDTMRGWDIVLPAWATDEWGDAKRALPSSFWPDGLDAENLDNGDPFEMAFDSVADDIATELNSAEFDTEGWGRDRILTIVTWAIERRRLVITRAAADFIRNVFFYFKDDGATIRPIVDRAIAEAIAKDDGPVVVAGHSLGGVIAVDALTRTPQPRTLLVTAGSQMPLFVVLGLAGGLKDDGVSRPFAPWLNVYNKRDPLSFVAENIFPPDPESSPDDRKIVEPRDLPRVHTAYFTESKLYDKIARRLVELKLV